MNRESITNFMNKPKDIVKSEVEIEKKESIYENEIVNMLKDEQDIASSKNDVFTKGKKQVFDNQTTSEKEDISTSLIAKDVIVNGDISAKGNLDVYGVIDGNVKCDHFLRVNGVIKGDVNASKVLLSQDLTGNIECEKNCEILENAVIHGNIKAENVHIKGKVIGNVCAVGKVILSNNALLEGDCNSAKIVIEEGAVVKGNMQIMLMN
ncbi:MAG: polymer-forming cytoskeletal protein [Erysipelotrichia bacterium]|nr:polymer-forming cytoskeletal protein [Erysipelotrichia bacterium]